MNTPTTAREQLIVLLNNYRKTFSNIKQFAHHHDLTPHQATALLWLAEQFEASSKTNDSIIA